MDKWLNELVLETAHVKLVPLRAEHKPGLVAAVMDGELSKLWFTAVPSPETMDNYIAKAIEDFELDKGLAFVVIDKRTNKIIGSTRYTNATPEHKRLEIGYTWYASSFQNTYINSECKLALLTHAFEELNAIATEFRTNWYNFRSRNAIARLGAKQDGVLRNHQVMADGLTRDTVVFSIIASEWPTCKRSLMFRIEEMHKKYK